MFLRILPVFYIKLNINSFYFVCKQLFNIAVRLNIHSYLSKKIMKLLEVLLFLLWYFLIYLNTILQLITMSFFAWPILLMQENFSSFRSHICLFLFLVFFSMNVNYSILLFHVHIFHFLLYSISLNFHINILNSLLVILLLFSHRKFICIPFLIFLSLFLKHHINSLLPHTSFLLSES